MKRKSSNRGESQRGTQVTGKKLNQIFTLGAQEGLYHKDGKWYPPFTGFPGVLCDSRGFVKYDNEKQFITDKNINIGKKVTIPGYLASHPRYTRKWQVDSEGNLVPQE
ncbi:MAG: hypothetical protein H7338_14150 [Candidatus Sericytochromatia bacterium]|nr:hypothetical protein [Candidatus Sericytochromatia bacterium]